MPRIVVFAFIFLSNVLPAAAQKPSSDSETLRALLTEIRQLRKDLQTTSVAAQRVQIVLYRLQGEREAIGQLAQSLQSARLELGAVQKNRQERAAEIKRAEEERDHNPNPGERAALESYISQAKAKLERLTAEEEQRHTQVLALETEMQSEQQKLEGLSRVLDQLDDALAGVGR